MADMAFLSSCLAINGHRIQFMTTEATTPTTIAPPRPAVMIRGEWCPSSVMRASDVTMKDRQPTRPDLYAAISRLSHAKFVLGGFSNSYRMVTLGESIEHRQQEEQGKNRHHIGIAVSRSKSRAAPDRT